MTPRVFRTLPVAHAVLLVVVVACSEEPSPGPPPTASGGSNGAAGRGGSGVGAAGRGGVGPSGGRGGAAGTTAAGSGPAAGIGGADASGFGGGGGGGAAGGGSAGKGGGPSYPSDLSPGPNVVPTDCLFAHGTTGCCGPDGNAYYVEPSDFSFEVQKEVCNTAQPCSWSNYQLRFACGGGTDGHPYGLPSSCGAPAYPAGCLNACKVDLDCKPEIWGEGARCYFPHPEATGSCVRCVVDADCPVGAFCDPFGDHYCRKRACDTDVECAMADANLPACSPLTATCVQCQTDAHCKAPGTGCFGNRCLCKTDEACVSSSLGRRCDAIERDCGCKTGADCPADTPLCITRTCAQCYGDGDCTQSAGKPYCVLDGPSRRCVACRKDTDCPSKQPLCEDGACVPGCSSSFDCSETSTVCGGGVCIPVPSCKDDDAAEPSDDSPLTTGRVLAAGVSEQGKVCGLEGERDNFRIALASTSDVTLELQSADPRVFVALSDGQGRLLALSMHMSPQRLRARALAAGTYYAVVGLAADEAATSASYLLTMQGGGAPCVSDVDCADVTSTEIYRGRCQPTSGACTFIEGGGALEAAAPCDDDGDCATGFCSGYAFAARPAVRSRCSAPCDGPTGLGQAPSNELCAAAGLDTTWVCTTFEDVNRCLPRCQTDEDCPLVGLVAAPAAGEPWRHLACDDSGHCQDIP